MTTDIISTEFMPCDLCGSSDQELLYSRVDPVTRREFHLVECGCGMAFVNPMPVEQSIPSLYPPDYLKDKAGMDALYRRMVGLLPSNGAGRKLLDIGCGKGDFIHFAASQGWKAEGVDLIAWNTPHNVSITVGDFLQMELPDRHYDVITAWALLEHVRRPSAFFAKISQLLKDDAAFVFVVPNFSAPGMRRSCIEDIPRHLRLFTPRSVHAYLDRYGMRVREISHRGEIYTAYPFGALRFVLANLRASETACSKFENRSVALLRNRQIRGNLREWLREVFARVGPLDLLLDAADLALGLFIARYSQLIGNYGVMTVVAEKAGRNRPK